MLIEKANNYIQQNKFLVNDEYRLNYHLMAPIGWINDPNGFSYFNNQYHLFYQYHPFNSNWGPMHWGHSVSNDLVNWENKSIALAPDTECDCDGCFSGTAMVENNKLYVMYTGVNESDKAVKQQQCIAVSDDGQAFNKNTNNPVITCEQLPKYIFKPDFRDPKLWHKDYYYTIVGSSTKDKIGQLLLYKSKDLNNWEFINNIIDNNGEFGEMIECPDFFNLDNRDILTISAVNMPKQDYSFLTNHSVLYFIGNLDYNIGKYSYINYDELDFGFDFYAPQIVKSPDGRYIMIAWMSSWERESTTTALNHNWAGAMTMPRELYLKNNKLYQRPIKELKNYRQNELKYDNILIDGFKTLENTGGNSIEIELEIDLNQSNLFTINLFKSSDEELVLSYSKLEQKFIIDRTKCGHTLYTPDKKLAFSKRAIPYKLSNNCLKLNIFIDKSSAEIFIDEGLKTITTVVYPKNKDYKFDFYSDKPAYIKSFKQWEIIK